MRTKLGCVILSTAIVGTARLLAGCGAGSVAPPPPAIIVGVSPSSAMVDPRRNANLHRFRDRDNKGGGDLEHTGRFCRGNNHKRGYL